MAFYNYKLKVTMDEYLLHINIFSNLKTREFCYCIFNIKQLFFTSSLFFTIITHHSQHFFNLITPFKKINNVHSTIPINNLLSTMTNKLLGIKLYTINMILYNFYIQIWQNKKVLQLKWTSWWGRGIDNDNTSFIYENS